MSLRYDSSPPLVTKLDSITVGPNTFLESNLASEAVGLIGTVTFVLHFAISSLMIKKKALKKLTEKVIAMIPIRPSPH